MTFLKHMLQDKKVGTQPQFHKKEKKKLGLCNCFSMHIA